MLIIKRLFAWLSSLKVAIFLLLIIAVSSAIGTAIPQGELAKIYLEKYQQEPWLGFVNGENILRLQLDHLYTSIWFLALLTWLGIALIICSLRRQIPTLKASIRWVDYKEPRQIKKLAVSDTIRVTETKQILEKLATDLKQKGWEIKQSPGRIAARKGVISRAGPPLVHIGLVMLMMGAVWSSTGGQRLERFLAPGRSIDLLNRDGLSQLKLTLRDFQIERDPEGRAEQFKSKLELFESGKTTTEIKEVSVNNPIRFHGLTIYQADWSLAAITLQLGQSPKLQLPLASFPELGEQIWGVVLPTQKDGRDPILISLSKEEGPAQIFNENGEKLASIRPGGLPADIKGMELRITDVLVSSGLLLKRDPGVPLVYTSFAITLLGGGLSVLATKQLWAIEDSEKYQLHIGGLSNRNLTGLGIEISQIITSLRK